jgi:hypothetical protein
MKIQLSKATVWRMSERRWEVFNTLSTDLIGEISVAGSFFLAYPRGKTHATHHDTFWDALEAL